MASMATVWIQNESNLTPFELYNPFDVSMKPLLKQPPQNDTELDALFDDNKAFTGNWMLHPILQWFHTSFNSDGTKVSRPQGVIKASVSNKKTPKPTEVVLNARLLPTAPEQNSQASIQMPPSLFGTLAPGIGRVVIERKSFQFSAQNSQ